MKDEIIQGLKMAMIKGESLQEAMQSFYNSGYNKAEIEEAARELQGLQAQLSEESKIFNQNQIQKTQPPVQKSPAGVSQQKPAQTISNYEQAKKINPRFMWVVIISILLLVIGAALIGVYFYRESIINFFSSPS